MNKIIKYAKYVGFFMIFELMITFISSLLNLLGINSGITTIILLISNIIIFLILNFFNAKTSKKKGFLEGIILGFIFIVLMILIKIILFNNAFSISTFIYYLILLFCSILGGMFGANKKQNE